MNETALPLPLVELERHKRSHWKARGWGEWSITKSLPFYQSRQGTYVHRVRSGHVLFYPHRMKGGTNHTSFKMWCGQMGYFGERHGGTLMAQPPPLSVICATCEGRAIGSGQLGAPIICGRAVKYSPRY